MSMLIIDGVKYNLWIPREEKQLEKMVKEHFKEIFGEVYTLYFDIKPELRSQAGIGSKPDGVVVDFEKPCFYVIEIERAEHGVHEHIVTQISRFNSALKSLETRMKIADVIYNEIVSNPVSQSVVKTKVKGEMFRFLTDLFSRKPVIVIIIDKATEELKEAIGELRQESRIIEFKTFERVGLEGKAYAHLFEPLSSIEKPPETEREKRTLTRTEKEYVEFYRDLVLAIRDKVPTTLSEYNPKSYYQISTGISSVHYEWVFHGRPRRSFGVELHFEKGNKETNRNLLKEIEKYKDEIEKETGEKVIFQENWGKAWARLYIERDEGRMTNELKRWAVEKMVLLIKVLQPKLNMMK